MQNTFVHQQYVHGSSKNTHETNSSLHVAGQLVREFVVPLNQVEHFEPFIYERGSLGNFETFEFKSERQIFCNGSPRQQSELLKHHRNKIHAKLGKSKNGYVDLTSNVRDKHMPIGYLVKSVDCVQENQTFSNWTTPSKKRSYCLDRNRRIITTDYLIGLR